MKLRTRAARTAEPGALTCHLCGRQVPFGPDGRCFLGHRVPGWVAPQADEPTGELPIGDPVTTVPTAAPAGAAVAPGVAVPTEAAAPTRLDYLHQLGDLDALQSERSVAGHHHPYDDVLSWASPGDQVATGNGPTSAAPQTAPLAAAAAVASEPAGGAWSVDQLLGWDAVPADAVAPSAEVVSAPEQPTAQQPAVPEPASSWDSDDADVDGSWYGTDEDDEAAEDARMQTRHRLAIAAGGTAVTAVSVWAVSLALFA